MNRVRWAVGAGAGVSGCARRDVQVSPFSLLLLLLNSFFFWFEGCVCVFGLKKNKTKQTT